jgi:nucleoside-diphosphate-sugar epimerase
MVHGPGNKGNLNLLYNFCKYFRFWPLGSFDNERSFCSVYNLCFVIDELSRRRDVESGVYNVADDTTISTNEIISIISSKFGKKIRNLKIPKSLIITGLNILSFLGIHSLKLKFQKLTENFIVSNTKIKLALGKPLPVEALEGIKKTIDSFE